MTKMTSFCYGKEPTVIVKKDLKISRKHKVFLQNFVRKISFYIDCFKSTLDTVFISTLGIFTVLIYEWRITNCRYKGDSREGASPFRFFRLSVAISISQDDMFLRRGLLRELPPADDHARSFTPSSCIPSYI